MDFDDYQNRIDRLFGPQRGNSYEYVIDSFTTNMHAMRYAILRRHLDPIYISGEAEFDPDAFSEDLADILWLVARVASACDLRLADLAHRVTDRTDTPTD